MRPSSIICGLWLTVAFCRPLPAATVTWFAGGTNDWFTGGNWLGGVAPTNGDDVVITNTGCTVLLTNSTPDLNSFFLSNRVTLVFSNWDTTLNATNVTLGSNCVLTLPNAFTNDQMSNNITIACSNLTIGAGASINVNSRGYLGRPNATGLGPGAGTGNDSGGYGGKGGGGGGGSVYGSAETPIEPGSSGGSASIWVAGSGGGAVRIRASGVVTIDGTITANGGGSGTYCGGGSGGAIYINCVSLAGTGGGVSARGGVPESSYSGGGGGRIAVHYDTNAQALLPIPAIRFDTGGGIGEQRYGGVGTLYFPDNRFLTETFLHAGQWSVPNFTNWAPGELVVSNTGWLSLPADGFRLTISNRLLVAGSVGDAKKLELTNGVLTCGGDIVLNNAALALYRGETSGPSFYCSGNLVLTNGGSLYCYSGLTNGSGASDRGALIEVVQDTWIATNSALHLMSHPTNGGSVLVKVRSLMVARGGTINADARGYMGTLSLGYGPGAGNGAWIAGGYGGQGGGASGGYGMPYGDSNAPVSPGSAGGGQPGYIGSSGGGAVRVQASGAVMVDGTITANGGGGNYTAAGSGGGIYITCYTIAGNGGTIRAGGGVAASTYPEGGGGRIAIWRIRDSFAGSVSAAGGVGGGAAGANGTIVWGQLPFPGSMMRVQ